MLTRWDPFQEMLNLRSTVDRLFDQTFGQQMALSQSANWGLALDVAENPEDFVVKASLPGVDPEDIEITYSENLLTIKGEVKSDREIKEEQYHLRERRYGAFSRSITLPKHIQADKIQANCDNGVLTLRLPKAEEAKPKRISVQVSSPKLIEAKAHEKK